MKKMAEKILTKDQIEYRNSILKPKPKTRKVSRLQTIISRTEYMNNCIFWINEYHAKRTTVERLISATTNLRNYCQEIINENKTNTNAKQ